MAVGWAECNESHQESPEMVGRVALGPPYRLQSLPKRHLPGLRIPAGSNRCWIERINAAPGGGGPQISAGARSTSAGAASTVRWPPAAAAIGRSVFCQIGKATVGLTCRVGRIRPELLKGPRAFLPALHVSPPDPQAGARGTCWLWINAKHAVARVGLKRRRGQRAGDLLHDLDQPAGQHVDLEQGGAFAQPVPHRIDSGAGDRRQPIGPQGPPLVAQDTGHPLDLAGDRLRSRRRAARRPCRASPAKGNWAAKGRPAIRRSSASQGCGPGRPAGAPPVGSRARRRSPRPNGSATGGP